MLFVGAWLLRCVCHLESAHLGCPGSGVHACQWLLCLHRHGEWQGGHTWCLVKWTHGVWTLNWEVPTRTFVGLGMRHLVEGAGCSPQIGMTVIGTCFLTTHAHALGKNTPHFAFYKSIVEKFPLYPVKKKEALGFFLPYGDTPGSRQFLTTPKKIKHWPSLQCKAIKYTQCFNRFCQ